MKLTPVASILTSASPSFGSGRGTSSYRRASAPPGVAIRTAFIRRILLPLGRDLRRHLAPGVAGFFDGALVLDRRDVARLLAERDRLQDPAHDLAAARLRQHVHEVQLPDDRDRTELPADRVEELLAKGVRTLLPLLQ